MLTNPDYETLKTDLGFDPEAPGPEVPVFEPWTLRGVYESLTGRVDLTQWTRRMTNQLILTLDSKGEGGDTVEEPGKDKEKETEESS